MDPGTGYGDIGGELLRPFWAYALKV